MGLLDRMIQHACMGLRYSVISSRTLPLVSIPRTTTDKAANPCAKAKTTKGNQSPALTQRSGVTVGAKIPANRPRLAATPEPEPLILVG